MAERAERWLRTKTKLRPSSRVRLEEILANHVLARFGDYRLDSVSNAEVQEWVSTLTPATAHKAYDALSQIMSAEVANREIVYSPCQSIGLPQVDTGEQRFLSPDEVALLAECIDGDSGHSYCWLPTAACASGNSRGFDEDAWTYSGGV